MANSKKVNYDFWKPRQRTILANLVGIALTQLSDILYRNRGLGKERALLISQKCKLMGVNVPFEAWLFNKTTKHPAFFGKPHKAKK